MSSNKQHPSSGISVETRYDDDGNTLGLIDGQWEVIRPGGQRRDEIEAETSRATYEALVASGRLPRKPDRAPMESGITGRLSPEARRRSRAEIGQLRDRGDLSEAQATAADAFLSSH